ncbi:MAG: PTS system mannose/fructose/sorbose family transporter subunit IID [Erysipelotrichaceae bacterium]|nr:PTS system mannose/fructose/sorbose family transporter subunit IID [Erysipelotrichaceae bacterium]
MSEKKNSLLYLDSVDKKVVNETIWRAARVNTAFNYETMQGVAFVNSMAPVIEEYYSDARGHSKQDRITAYLREDGFFNITPQVAPFLACLIASMEKEASMNPDYDVASINGVRAALMGPLSGIGDSLFWGSFKILSTGLAVGYSLQGSILGPIIYFVSYNIPSAIVRHVLPIMAWNGGSQFLRSAAETGIIPLITQYATIVGLMTMGAMTTSFVNINIKLGYTYSGPDGDIAFNVQSLIDSIVPKILPVLFTLWMLNLIRVKHAKPWQIILGIILCSVIGVVLHVL